mmetsp:Transcript_46597/g.105294  ORF Transcript_46597/g.105294 Transcript_46597/m.105294 type:complete len:244 (+) Transcript_46597:383-1114(+)
MPPAPSGQTLRTPPRPMRPTPPTGRGCQQGAGRWSREAVWPTALRSTSSSSARRTAGRSPRPSGLRARARRRRSLRAVHSTGGGCRTAPTRRSSPRAWPWTWPTPQLRTRTSQPRPHRLRWPGWTRRWAHCSRAASWSSAALWASTFPATPRHPTPSASPDSSRRLRRCLRRCARPHRGLTRDAGALPKRPTPSKRAGCQAGGCRRRPRGSSGPRRSSASSERSPRRPRGGGRARAAARRLGL